MGRMDLSGRRLAIFGCGYLGERVAREGLARGLEVTALTRNRDQAERLKAERIPHVVVAELDGDEWHARVAPGQDFVVNCVSSGGGGLAGYERSYYRGMQSVLRWAAAAGPGRIVFTSSTSVYAQGEGEWVMEEHPAEGATDGAAVLRRTERLLEAFGPAGADAWILRLGGIYGPGRHRLLDRVLAGMQEEEGDDVLLNPIHLEDAAAAVWCALEAPAGLKARLFNIVDDSPTPKKEILAWLQEEARSRGLLPRSPAPRSGAARPSSGKSRRISNRRAKELLGWRPRFSDFRAGYAGLLKELENKERQ